MKNHSVLGTIALMFATSGAAGADHFRENWSGATSPHFTVRAPSAEVLFNIPEETAGDGRVLQLLLPANPRPSPGGGAEIQSRATYLYGHFRTRLKTADCSAQPGAGVVTGYFTYLNDGKDYNGNGLPDNCEIDFEWLGAQPEVVYMTMWTDYRDADAAQRRVGRAINLKTGQILYTCYYEAFGKCQPLAGPEAEPTTVPALPEYNSATSFYEYGFDWTPTGVTWWMTNPENGRRLVLWDYQGPSARIPSRASYYMTNLWHTPGWAPEGMPGAVQKPTVPLSAFVDWTEYATRAEPTEQRVRRPKTGQVRTTTD